MRGRRDRSHGFVAAREVGTGGGNSSSSPPLSLELWTVDRRGRKIIVEPVFSRVGGVVERLVDEVDCGDDQGFCQTRSAEVGRRCRRVVSSPPSLLCLQHYSTTTSSSGGDESCSRPQQQGEAMKSTTLQQTRLLMLMGVSPPSVNRWTLQLSSLRLLPGPLGSLQSVVPFSYPEV